ncbi:MAG TPA: DUF1735 domain-containing protein [Puia sp.]|nr:DUF1735 domain-containing protein [Puia sp.]
MKKEKRIYQPIILVLLFAGALSLSSCLKNGQYATDFSKVAASVDLSLAAANNNGVVAFSYDATVTSTSIPVYVDVASPSLPGTSTSVTLALDTAYLNAYNNNNGTDYSLMPDSIYTTSGWNLTVPKGQRLDSMNVTFNFAKMDLTQNYILPITISQSSLPIEQYNHLLLYISVKNKYDGHYTVTGTFTDVTNANFTNDYPMDIDLVTSGPNSVDVFNTLLGGVGYVFKNGGTVTYYGSFGIRMFFDANDNVTSVINTYGQPAGNTRSAQLDPSGTNAEDGSHNIDVKYFMIQPSAVPTPPNIRSYFNEHYAYLGPR